MLTNLKRALSIPKSIRVFRKKNKAALVSKTAWVLRDLVEYGCTSARRTGGSDGDRFVDTAL